MTVACLGGTSSGRSEYGRFVYMAPSAIGAFLNNIPTPWAVYFAGTIGSLTYDLSTFCTTDPPAMPTMGADDWAALINPYTLSASVLARSKFRDWLGALLWPTLCQCDTVATPAAPSPGSPPANLPVLNPPQVGPAYPTGQPCQTFTFQDGPFPPNAGQTTPMYPLNGATYVTMDWTANVIHTTSNQVGFDLFFYNDAGTQVGSALIVGVSTSGNFVHAEVAVPAGATQFHFFWAPTSTPAPAVTFSVDVNFYCGTTPSNPTGGPAPTPCPTDPFTQLQLDQLLALVTLIQRQVAPFAYVPGGVHSGLSGDGHLAVQGLIGVKVVLDSTGSSVGFLSGDPAEVYSAGWITWGNADGSSKREFITHSPFVSLPALAGQYTRLGYTLGDGVSATITELVREP